VRRLPPFRDQPPGIVATTDWDREMTARWADPWRSSSCARSVVRQFIGELAFRM
jgi:hypothetical protein